MEPNVSKILQGLDPAQRAAAVDYDAPSLIIAGAGSGKTRVLTARIAYMIEQGVAPSDILALTFTNKAAEQMRARIAALVPGSRCRHICMGTFHSVFSRLLREHAERIGFPPSFTIYDSSDSKNLLSSLLRELDLAQGRNDSKSAYSPGRIAARISYFKNALKSPGAYLADATFAAEDRKARIPEFGRVYDLYCRRCKQNGAMDFDDLLLQTDLLLREHPDVLARCQERFGYILVDEYQDTNYAQYVIIRRLAQRHGRVCAVGDDAQSIYSFRGAKIENILSFRKDYPEAKIFKLERNYRSTRTIVGAANSVIARNAKRLEKNCFSEGDEGAKIRILRACTDREEAEAVVADLRGRVREAGAAWSGAAILYRTNGQAKAFEDDLRRRGIPYRIYKGSSFYDRKEIRDVLAYLRLAINPRDDEAFRRIVNHPARGIGPTTVGHIARLAAERGLSMLQTVEALAAGAEDDPVQRAIARKTADFAALIGSLSAARAGKELYDFGMEAVSRSGLLALYRAEHTPEAASALDNIESLLNSMQQFKEQREAEIRSGERREEERATVEEWLQNVMLMTDMDREDAAADDCVTLMTVHAAKGLEYDYVYIAGLEEQLFPSPRAAETDDGMEEERRLFYVALTRAKVAATISYAEMRFRWGNMECSRPSRFLREIDPRYLDTTPGDETLPARGGGAGPSIDELRRRFDYRFRQRREGGSGAAYAGRAPLGGAGARSGYGGGLQGGRGGYAAGASRSGGAGAFGSRPADGESGAARRYPSRSYAPGAYGGGRMQGASGGAAHTAGAASGRSGGGAPRSSGPDPSLVQAPRASTDGLRRPGAPPADGTGAAAGDYAVGERVGHPKFGAGVIRRIETLAADCKLVVDFGPAGEKTLLAKFAKLTKL